MLIDYILLVYVIAITTISTMCLENTFCFYAMLAGTTMLNILVYIVVTAILDMMSTTPFEGEKYRGMTLVMHEVSAKRFLKKVDIDTYDIKVVTADAHYCIIPDEKPIKFVAFSSSQQETENNTTALLK